MSQRLDAAFDLLAEQLAESCRKSRERLDGQRIARLRKFFGLCQRCGLRPHDGSRLMCRECWQDTGPYDRPIGEQE